MRVISLLPGATEIVAALGLERALVAVTHECDWPPGLGARPRVTRTTVDGRAAPDEVDRQVRDLNARGAPLFELDAETIRALAPTVVLTQALCDVCAVSELDVRTVAATLVPPPAVVTLDGTTLDGVFGDIARVAHALRVPDEGARLVASLRRRAQAVHERLAAARAPRPRVVVVEWPDPLFIAGHWTPELIRRAGGQDALARPGEHSRTVSVGELEDADANVVLIAPCGYDAERAARIGERLLAHDDWSWARSRSVWALDANALTSRPGPRLVDAIEVLAGILHPALFPAPTPDRAVPVGALTRA